MNDHKVAVVVYAILLMAIWAVVIWIAGYQVIDFLNGEFL